MHWLDTSALLILAGFAAFGWAVEFLRPALFAVSVVLSLMVTGLLAAPAADALGQLTGGAVGPGLVVWAMFILTLIFVSFIVGKVRRRFWVGASDAAVAFADSLRWLDRLAGAAAGVVIAATLIGGAVYVTDQSAGPKTVARLDGSRTLELAREHGAATVQNLSPQSRRDLRESLDWLKYRGDKPPANKT